MTKTITFNELRKIKDSLPNGGCQIIADRLGIDVDTVRNYFGGRNFNGEGKTIGVHVEPGPEGGIVQLDDTTILDLAVEMINKMK